MLPDHLTKMIELMDNSFDHVGGFLLVDREGKVVHITSRYAEFLGTDQNTALGKDVTEIIPETRMLEVLQTGIPQLADIWTVRNETAVVSRVPIIKKGRIIGAMAFSVFTRFDDALVFARRVTGMDMELDYYREEIKRLWEAKYSFDSITGQSTAINEAKRKAWDIAATSSPVLITGETGTGKELFAHAIHRESPYRNGPFISVNCASIPENLVESELFGYEEGAFTGARKGGKPGKFEMANGGTIFLDEIPELPMVIQSKLLRVLQEKEIERVGGTRVIPINARVISATNVSLEALIEEKKFRKDLYYRVNAFTINVPRLVERLEDIPILVSHFIRGFNREVGLKVSGTSGEAMEILQAYDWPGNVRELKSAVERACLDAKLGLIRADNLPHIVEKLYGTTTEYDSRVFSLKSAREQAERQAILRALGLCSNNKQKAARLLGINRAYLYHKMSDLGISQEKEL
ncbi:MAG: sigma-54 interaction domain-containing protein [Chitinophagales bacterium]